MPSHIDPAIFVHARIGQKAVVYRLVESTSCGIAAGVGHLVMFWGAASLNTDGGCLDGISDVQIEAWAGWTGKRGAFAKWVREQHLDEDGRIREWDEYAGRLAERRRKDRERQRKNRQMSRGQSADDPRDIPQTSVDRHTSRKKEGINNNSTKGAGEPAPFMGGVRAIWKARFDAPPPAQAVKALRAVVNEHGELTMLSRLETYLDRTEARFVDLFRFAATFGDWAPKGAKGANGLQIDDAATAFAKLGI